MSDADARIVALLEELVGLHKIAAERQERMLQRNDEYYAAARQRSEQAIALQQTAIARQRTFLRAWLAVLVFVIACVVGLLVAISRYLH